MAVIFLKRANWKRSQDSSTSRIADDAGRISEMPPPFELHFPGPRRHFLRIDWGPVHARGPEDCGGDVAAFESGADLSWIGNEV